MISVRCSKLFVAPNNNSSKRSACLGEVARRDGRALALDALSDGVGIASLFPGLSVAGAGVQTGLSILDGAAIGLSIGSTVNSAVGGDLKGSLAGQGGLLSAATAPAAKFAQGESSFLARALPGVGLAISAYATYHDVSEAIGHYNECMSRP